MTLDPSNLASTATQTFDDEFNNLSLYNGTSGTWSTTFWYDDPLTSSGNTLDANGEQEWYINSNYGPTSSVKPWTVNNGVLTLTAKKAPASIQSLINGYQYTSGMINTYHSFSQEYGYFEMRAKLPAGQGMWPAFWLLPEDGSWPPEIDVMEMLGNDPTMLYTSTHSEQNGQEVNAGPGTKVADMSKGYHTYAVDWEADYITYYFDGKQVWKTPTPSDMHKPMYMIANLAVGGYWPGNVDSTTKLPAQMKIDWIRAYQSNPNGGGTGGTGTTLTANNTAGQVLTGTSGNDTFFAGNNSVKMTGGAGDDTFVFNKASQHAAHIADFTPGSDKIDVTALLNSFAYTGNHPFADGYIHLKEVNGSTKVYYDPDGANGPKGSHLFLILDGVSKSSVHASDFIFDSNQHEVFTATGNGQHVQASLASDLIKANGHSATMTGHAGADSFVFNQLGSGASNITDFGTGTDRVNVSPLLKSIGYSGSDPFGDGTLTVQGDGAGDTKLILHHNGTSSTIAVLDNVKIGDLHMAHDFVTGYAYTGSSGGSGTGETLTGNDTSGQVLTGTAGNDTFIAGHDSVVMTGKGGSDTFVFNDQPWNAGHITDFTPGTDKIDVSALLTQAHYAGSQPFSDGYLSLVADGSGNTKVMYNPTGPGTTIPITVTTLDHLTPSQVHASDFIFH
jgi:beta-glucanase (GH16 family)